VVVMAISSLMRVEKRMTSLRGGRRRGHKVFLMVKMTRNIHGRKEEGREGKNIFSFCGIYN